MSDEKPTTGVKKRSPNRLIVDEAVNDDNSVISLSAKKNGRFRIISWRYCFNKR